MNISQEYTLAIALFLGAVLKAVGIELENSAIEALIVGVGALWIAIRRKAKGDINIAGVKLN